MGFTAQVFVVVDGSQAQNCTGATEALQDPVNAAFGLVRKPLDEGAVGRKEQDGFRHKEAELKQKGEKNSYRLIVSYKRDAMQINYNLK